MDELINEFKTICYVSADDNGHIIYKCIGAGEAPEGTTEITPEQYECIDSDKISGYRLEAGKIVFDQEKYDAFTRLQDQDGIRRKRESECFSICDRAVWFYSLTEEQKAEVQHWRQAWLDAPETGVMPVKPVWID